MKGETGGPGGGTYFQPILYVDFLGYLGLSLSSHNSSEKKVRLRFMKLAAGGTTWGLDAALAAWFWVPGKMS